MRPIKFRDIIQYGIEGNSKLISTREPKHKDAKGWYYRHGYVYRLVNWHPYMDSRGYVAEHRLVMERHLGRVLEPTEFIHHRDQNRENNKLDNLELQGNQAIHAKKHMELRGKRNTQGQFVADEPIFSEIKFRLYNKNTKTTRIYSLATLIGATFRRAQFEFRGRWTGLTDKNGKEIYEGDIVNHGDNYPSEVVFDNYGWKLREWGYEKEGYKYRQHELITYTNPIEVIGNIYENPELLV